MHAVSPKLVPWLADLNQRNAALIANGYLPTAISAREGLAGMTFLQVQPGPPLALPQPGANACARKLPCWPACAVFSPWALP